MLPGWSSDPYVIVKLCDHDEVIHKKQTKTVNNDTNPEFDEKRVNRVRTQLLLAEVVRNDASTRVEGRPRPRQRFKFKEVQKPGSKKLKFEIWDSDIGRDDKIGHGHFHLGNLCSGTTEYQQFDVVVDGGGRRRGPRSARVEASHA